MKTIAIMRPQQYLPDSIKLAKSYGYDVIAAPMIEIRERNDPEFDVFVQRVLNRSIDYVIFTSANGVIFTLEKVGSKKFVDALNACNIIAIGPNTQRELEKHAIHVDIIPATYSSDGIVSALASFINEKEVEVVRSSHGDPALIEGLEKHGAHVHEAQVYEIIRPTGKAQKGIIQAALDGKIDTFIFTSAMTVANFLKTAEDLGKKDEVIRAVNRKTIAAIGTPTADALASNNIHVDILPKKFTFKDLLDELEVAR
ncbi:MAG: uroporphyrinogen-III synthase [Methanocellales archaeon]|nr:uroporphyrinogen-III synthase [Methanocellales archaeon]